MRARTYYSFTYSFVYPNIRIIGAERVVKVVLVRTGTVFFSKSNNTVKNNVNLFYIKIKFLLRREHTPRPL